MKLSVLILMYVVQVFVFMYFFFNVILVEGNSFCNLGIGLCLVYGSFYTYTQIVRRTKCLD